MGEIDNKAVETDEPTAEDPKAQFERKLREYADSIRCVRNDVYTTKWWQFVVNFIVGGGALAFLVMSMIFKDTMMTVSAVCGIALVIGLIVFNYVLRSMSPTSFLQYTSVEKNRRVTFRILSKTRATFTDGDVTIESNRDMAAKLKAPLYPQYRFDFFKDMSVSARISEGRRETYSGTFECDGKTYKCKIVFVEGKPVYGSVGGARIKYFDVNYTKDKFVVPYALKAAAKALDVVFPKLPGIYVRDDVKDLTKQ